MEALLLFVLGAAVGAAVVAFRRRTPAQPQGAPDAPVDAAAANAPPSPAATEPPTAELPTAETAAAAPAAAPEPPPTLASRLYALAGPVSSFVDDSAHPRELLEHAEFKSAVDLLLAPDVPIDVVVQYATGANWTLSCVAYNALASRAERQDVLPTVLPRMRDAAPWALFFVCRYLCSLQQRPPAGHLVLFPREFWSENRNILAVLGEYFANRVSLGDAVSFGDTLSAGNWDRDQVVALLKNLSHPGAAALIEELEQWRTRTLDRAYLESFGRFWNEEDFDLLIEADALRGPLAEAETNVLHDPPRSVVVIGEARSGKTSLLRLLAHRLGQQGWAVFEASGADLMAGQIYIGQLEERLKRICGELSASKRVAWYARDLLQLAMSGTHKGQASSMLDQLLPAITRGELVLLAEASPSGYTRLLQERPTLRNIVQFVRLHPLGDAEVLAMTSEFVIRTQRRFKVTFDADVVANAMYLSRHYLGTMQMPGAVIDLVKLATNRAVAADEDRVTRRTLLATLSQLTGLPASILDDSERVSLEEIRGFFAARVMGQEEASNTIVDRIAMLKAGLTDPGRPIAVFMFAGPTGTGKTELAKALAEYLFGSVERMIRLDMSEFQGPDSVARILGASAEGEMQSLVQRIVKQPFSVVLLDEFEKAHANVWDLFLQVFDDGRLTDSLGRTADFRHAIVILTSNLGATSHRSSGLGFAPRADAFTQEQVMRAVSQGFRPEFVNRLDKVIVFRPLTRELMRRILHKELQRVLERRGLRNREWAVEWEASAIEFLLDRGFSPEMGARPLKRAIDQHLLAPLAATMVERRFPEGDQFLFVRSDGRSIQVEFVDPDAQPGEVAAAAPATTAQDLPLAAMILQPAGTSAERSALDQRVERVERLLASDEWEALKSALSQEMHAPGFWDRSQRHAVLARFALTDRVKAATATARALRERLVRGTSRTGVYSRELVSRLALQIHSLERGVEDALRGAPIEIALAVQPAVDAGASAADSQRWCEQLLDMYRGWAGKRHMQIEENRGEGPKSGVVLLISGFGAWTTLREEIGLHVLDVESAREGAGRVVARVRVVESPLGETQVTHQSLLTLLNAAPASNQVVRRYRLDASPLVRDARGWRTGRAQLVLDGDFDLVGALN